MKKTLLIISFVLSAYFNVEAEVLISDILGSYKGKLDVFMKAPGEGEEFEKISEKNNVEVFTIEQNEKTCFTFLLENFSLPIGTAEFPVGDIRVPNVEIDNNGQITKGYVVLDKSDVPILGKLPTTVSGTLLPMSADLAIKVIWDFSSELPQEGSPSASVIDVKFIGAKATSSIAEVVNNISIANTGNSIEFIGADLKDYYIYNVQGKLISGISCCNNNIIDFSVFNNGIYIIKANTNKGTIVKKIVKK